MFKSYETFVNEDTEKALYKVGDKVVSAKGEVYNAADDVKVSGTRTGKTHRNVVRDKLNGLVSKVEVDDEKVFEVVEIQPGSYTRNKQWEGKIVYFLKDSKGDLYCAPENYLEEVEKAKSKSENEELKYYYLAKLTGATVKEVKKSKHGGWSGAYEVHVLSRTTIGASNRTSTPIGSFWKKEDAREAMEFMKSTNPKVADPHEYSVSVESKHLYYFDIDKLIKLHDPDFTEDKLKDVRGMRMGKDSGII